MGSEPLRNFRKEYAITSQIIARIFDFKTRDEGVRKPCHIVRKWLFHFGDCVRRRRRIRSFGRDRVFDLDEFKAALSTTGAVQSESCASCTRRLRGVALQYNQHSDLWYSLDVERTFFFCFRQASHPRPEGTPGIVLRDRITRTMNAIEYYKA